MKRILLDCDGILADFYNPYLKFINNHLGSNYCQNDISTWEALDCLNLQHLSEIVKCHVKSEGFCLNIPPYEESIEGFNKLKEICHVVIVTSPTTSKFWFYERLQWLEKYFNIDPHDVIFAKQKHLICGDMLIDDYVKNCIDWIKEHPTKKVAIWDRPWNKNCDIPILRLKDWNNLYEILK